MGTRVGGREGEREIEGGWGRDRGWEKTREEDRRYRRRMREERRIWERMRGRDMCAQTE